MKGVKKLITGKAIHKIGKAGVSKKSGNLVASPNKDMFVAKK